MAKNSPAEVAGLKEGDILVSINKLFNQNLQDYKQAMQNVGQKVKMIISRNGELLEFEFKVKSIF